VSAVAPLVAGPGAAPPPLLDEVDRLLRRLRLPYLRRAAAEVLATARAQRWDPAEALRVLLAQEVAGREQAMTASRRAAAGFPSGKTFDAWDEGRSSIPAPAQRALATLEWVGRAENLCLCGPSGTGKSHFLEALGHKAVDAGQRVTWLTLEGLAALVHRHRVDGTVGKALARLCKADLLVVDDIGMLPIGPDAAEAFYRLVDAAYERRALAVSSNLHPAGFDTLMPKTLATATVDRLLHHAHVVVTQGESFRLGEAAAGKGVVPLT
jgi:DNA replication protein DnaC